MVDENAAGLRSVQLAIDVLEAVAFSTEERGVTQIADRLHVGKGSVQRRLHTLFDCGYLTQNPATARYSIGPRVGCWPVSPVANLVQLAEDPMRELRDALGHTVVFSAMTPCGALVLATISSKWPVEIGVRLGSELSFHSSAQGKVLLSCAPRSFQSRILASPVNAFTAKTIVARDRIEKELAKISKRGYSAAPEETLLGINGVAAPVFHEHNNCVAALAIIGSIQFLPKTPKAADVAPLRAASERISRKLGYGRQQNSSFVEHHMTNHRNKQVGLRSDVE